MLKMKQNAKLVLSCSAFVVVSACTLNPRAYETTPVEVATAKGTVTCQLYTPDLVVWDRAIDRPENMSVEEGDQVCLAEGKRRATPS